jgi:hypothetical protein
MALVLLVVVKRAMECPSGRRRTQGITKKRQKKMDVWCRESKTYEDPPFDISLDFLCPKLGRVEHVFRIRGSEVM